MLVVYSDGHSYLICKLQCVFVHIYVCRAYLGGPRGPKGPVPLQNFLLIYIAITLNSTKISFDDVLSLLKLQNFVCI